MCTVTYLPTSSGFIFTSNRDEIPLRAASTLPPAAYNTDTGTLYFPKDAQGGTWFGVAANGRIHCLLNGAFKKHAHKPPYRKSRGLVVLESLGFRDAEAFAGSYDLSGIEPFTMVMVEPDEQKSLFEFRWDGLKVHLTEKDVAQPNIWSSATLYDETATRKREDVFKKWMAGLREPDNESVMQLHFSGSYGDPKNDFRMNRDGIVQTVSITQITSAEGNQTLFYRDLLSGMAHSLAVK